MRRLTERVQYPGLGQKVVVGVLRVDAGLHGMALLSQMPLLPGQGLAVSHADLPRHQVKPGDHFGDRVLHLQPGIHLHEEELVAVRIVEEFHCAGANVINCLATAHSSLAHGLTNRVGYARRGRFLDDLLVPALHGAITVEQVDPMSLLIKQHLDLHMPGRLQIPLQQQPVVTEG